MHVRADIPLLSMTDLESKTLIFQDRCTPMSPGGNTRSPCVLGAPAYLEHVVLKNWQRFVKVAR
jgi:hypothetical protein